MCIALLIRGEAVIAFGPKNVRQARLNAISPRLRERQGCVTFG
jgi:hypothetical protein